MCQGRILVFQRYKNPSKTFNSRLTVRNRFETTTKVHHDYTNKFAVDMYRDIKEFEVCKVKIHVSREAQIGAERYWVPHVIV